MNHPPRLPDSLEFEPEPTLHACRRYAGFGAGLLDRLQLELPEVWEALTFYRPVRRQTDDVWAVDSRDGSSLVLQLDPDCEVIVLTGHTGQVEIGTWESRPEDAAMAFIRAELLKTTE